VGNYNITVSTTDSAGNYNTSPAAFTLHVTAPPPPTNTAPTLNLPSNPTAEATGPGGAAVSFNATANDAQDGPLTPTCTPASGSTFPVGSTQVDCSVKDSGGLTTSGFFAVTVQDTTKPVIAAHDAVTAEATGPGGANVSYTSPGTTDAVDGPGTANCTPASGSQFSLGDTTVTCNATDAAGNQATPTTFKVTVADKTPPEIAPHDDITANAEDASGATVNYTEPNATDNVDANVTVNCTPASGTKFSLGDTTVTCNATDAAGNKATPTTFKVTVADKTPPEIAPHDDITGVEATGADGATVNYTEPNATDNVDANVTVNCTPASGTKFSLGDTTVTCNATDAAGNEATPTTFKVTVSDTTAPVIASHADVNAEATGADGANVTYTSPGTTDAVDGPGTANCTPASGTKFSLGDTTVTCNAKDAAGNEATPTTFKVTVSDTTAPALTVPSSAVEVEATGANGATVNFASQVSANDAVDPSPQVTCTPASGTVFALGTTQVGCKAKDAAGNTSAEKTFDVTVKDTTAPALSTHLDENATATSSSGAVVNYTKPGATDAVDPNLTVTCSPAPGATFPVGSTTVSCTAKDAAGNTSAARTFKVNVSYGWSGFLQPINTVANMGTAYKQSVFKIGSTVPVKFQLTGASAGITDGNFYLKYIRTGSGDGIGESEVVATATGNTGTQFRYSEGHYIFNWSTKGITLAGNYEVRVYTDAAMTNLLGSQSIELKK
jgi:hypothetical protein